MFQQRDALAELRTSEDNVARSNKEEEDCLERNFHSTLLLGNIWQLFRWATNREVGGGGVFSQGASAKRPVDKLWVSSGRNTLTCLYPPWKPHVHSH